MTTVYCLECDESITAITRSRAHLRRDEHMMDLHQMFKTKTNGKVIYHPISPRSALAMVQRRNVDTGGLLSLIAGLKVLPPKPRPSRALAACGRGHERSEHGYMVSSKWRCRECARITDKVYQERLKACAS